MTQRLHGRVIPLKKISVHVSTDTVSFEGVMRDLAYEGACIAVKGTDEIPVYVDTRLLVHCHLRDLDPKWSDEILVARVRWIRQEKGETHFGVAFLDTGEYYHPRISSLMLHKKE